MIMYKYIKSCVENLYAIIVQKILESKWIKMGHLGYLLCNVCCSWQNVEKSKLGLFDKSVTPVMLYAC